MVSTTSLFSQIVGIINKFDFYRIVRKHDAEYDSKGFSSWDQFVAMLFCQLAQAKSLREISHGLKVCFGKLNHLGLVKAPHRSTLSYANNHRPWEETIGQTKLLNPGTLAGLFQKATFAVYDTETDKAQLVLLEKL